MSHNPFKVTTGGGGAASPYYPYYGMGVGMDSDTLVGSGGGSGHETAAEANSREIKLLNTKVSELQEKCQLQQQLIDELYGLVAALQNKLNAGSQKISSGHWPSEDIDYWAEG